jgi:hypothetical protein
VADDYSGYVAEVSYEGEAVHHPHQGGHGPGHGGTIGGVGGGVIAGAHGGSGIPFVSSGHANVIGRAPARGGRNWKGDKLGYLYH